MHNESARTARTDVLSHPWKHYNIFSNFKSIQLMQDLNYHDKSE